MTMARATALCLLAICLATAFAGMNEPEELQEQECPEDCHCYYFRINWVTDCSDSNLTTIPYDELSLNVYILDVNDNNIAQVGPFPSAIHMRRLQMAHNLLTELKYESFAGLTYLLDADFSYNAIKRVDPEAFRDSPGLITLELQHNPLDEVDGPFLNCRTLLYLDLNSCGIRHLNSRFFDSTPNLNTLDLSHNPLQRIELDPFDHMNSLERLKLNGCNLTYISSEAFSHMENLRELELADNELKTLNWRSVLAPLVRLEHLNIRHTGITNLPGDAFAKNLYLRELVLADNELGHLDIEDTLGHNLHSLQSLDLSNCNLQDQLSEEAFGNASVLRVLNLSGNPKFASDLTAVLRHLPKLHKLSLSNCELRMLPDAFHSLEHLEELDISHNPLNDAFIRLLNPLKFLEYLDMSYCSLGHVGSHTFAQMTFLKKLILSGNKIYTLEEGLFANLTSLQSLELNKCDLTTPIDPKVFGDRQSTDIIELKLSGNPLVIPDEGPLLPAQLSNLEILDLSNCNISHLNENIFSTTSNLTQLNLSGNSITGMENLNFLKRLRGLEHLDLSYNQLRTIHPKIFKTNPHLQSINLISNPFVCNCSIVDTWDWAVQEKGDLHVLVGSQSANFVTGSEKRRKALSCAYDEETYRNMIESTRIDGNEANRKYHPASRTWAKYVRESSCSRRL